MKKLLAAAILSSALLLGGCTDPVPPGYNGVIVTKDGIKPEIYGQGRVKTLGYDKLVLVQSASELRPAKVDVIMANRTTDKEGNITENLGSTMTFVVNVRYRLSSEPSVVISMLQDMKLDDVSKINTDMVYKKYGNMVVGRVSREVLGKYTPEEVLANLKTINSTIEKELKKSLNSSSPLVVSGASLGPITLPKEITSRIDKNKDAQLSLMTKAITHQKEMLDEANKKAIAEERKAREKIEAESLAQQNTILNASVSNKLIEFRKIQLRELEIEMMREALKTGSNNTIFIPYGSQDTTAAQMRMYQK